MDSKLFFVAGITGHVGGTAARQLLAQGHKVRTLARDPNKAADWAKQGVDVQQGDLNDASTLAKALTGVDGAFLLIPPSMATSPAFPEAKAVIASFQQALKQAAPARLVALSSFGSEQTSGVGLITATHLMEQGLAGLNAPVAFIRAGGFFDNYVPSLQQTAASGVFYSFMQPTDRPVLSVATPDIGQQVAELLAGPTWTGTRIIELGSPISPDELAQGMAEALGRPVQAQAVPREQWSSILESFGFPAGHTGAYEEMIDAVNSGWIHHGVPGTEAVPATLTPAHFYSQAAKS